MKTQVYTFLGFYMAIMFFSANAYSAEKLNFLSDLPPSATLSLAEYLAHTDQNLNDFEIASTDLNDDGIDEFILKQNQCALSPCAFKIIATAPEIGAFELAGFQAHSILLGNDYTHGVRNLMIFTTPGNDFAYTLYKWSPQKPGYEIKDH